MTDDPWAVPGSGQRPADVLYGYPTPPRRSRPVLVWVAIGVVVLVAAGGGIFAATRSHHPSHVAKAPPVPAASSAPAPSVAPSAPSSPLSSPLASSAPPESGPPGAAASGAPNSPGPANPGTGPLDGYVLSPTEVGNGVAMTLEDGGRDAVNTPTLNYCNFDYTSEVLRQTRVQVDYLADDGSVPASNEFVQYKAGGAAKALVELQRAVATCPTTFTSDGYVATQIVHEQTNPALLPHQIALSYNATSPANPSPDDWWAVVYQFDGNYFSGVYVYGPTRAAAVALAEQLGADAAHHLAQAVAGRPGTGGGTFAPLASPGAGGGVQV